jgi:CRP-like cAMP-binding protein
MRSGAQRLAAYLGELAEPSTGASCEIRLPVPKAVIAAKLDMKKETLSRLLRDLSGAGLITVNGGFITLLDRVKLGQLA